MFWKEKATKLTRYGTRRDSYTQQIFSWDYYIVPEYLKSDNLGLYDNEVTIKSRGYDTYSFIDL